jgi:hypothetical protein
MFFFACSKDEVITEFEGLNTKDNTETVANTQNSFSFNINAKAWSHVYDYTVTFDKLDYDMALSIPDLTTGDVSIQIFNDTKQMLYKGDFDHKINLAQTIALDEKPTKIKLIFSNLSASFSCTIKGK